MSTEGDTLKVMATQLADARALIKEIAGWTCANGITPCLVEYPGESDNWCAVCLCTNFVNEYSK